MKDFTKTILLPHCWNLRCEDHNCTILPLQTLTASNEETLRLLIKSNS